MTRTAKMFCVALGFLTHGAPLFAQAPARDGRLIVTVVDQTRAVLPGATVTITGLDEATKAITREPVKSTDQGIATIALPPGRYIVTAEFPGFEPGVLKDVRIRSVNDNKQMVVLAIQGLQDSVTVGRDKQESAADRNNGSFGSALTRDQVDALSDDPAEMAQQLQDMTGGGVIRVDSFEGGQLPPKAMIKSIHITRDAFAAENHSAGGLFIDIITQPGLGALRGGVNVRVRDGSLNARNAFAPDKGPERSQNYGFFAAGSLWKQK